ncbi:MAG: matrixin family metalloprotease [Bacteroidetes bacterium]|nr:matrixin family metalloprotease [Bacteroidota bacterium]MBX7046921.1 matrixin family metalloprotease [Ignavibacteria bacterium]
MEQTVVQTKKLRVLPANRYHAGDSTPFSAFDLNTVTQKELTDKFRISSDAAKMLLSIRKKSAISRPDEVLHLKEIKKKDFEILRRCGYGNNDNKFAITDVQPVENYVFSFKKISLKISFLNPSNKKIAIASIKVFWNGEPFTIEKEVSRKESEQGFMIFDFEDSQTLPPGPARFIVNLFSEDGGQSMFKVTYAVLPSNPLSLTLSPSTYYVTGTYSLRGYYSSSSDKFYTVVKLSVYNGASSSVTMSKNINWEFWDGGVGGSSVESGTGSLSSNFTIDAYSTWSTTITFSSPSGSGIYKKYEDKEDMTLKIEMQKTSGTKVSDTLTARVMAAFGVDIIRVASDSFTSQEYTDLFDAVDVTQSIYEAMDITLRDIGRYAIPDSSAGSYKYINSESECRDMFEDWTAYDADGVNIDTFVTHDFVGTSFDGLAGDIPGPMSDSGRKSGVGVDKTGYVDGSGDKRLSIDYLGMLIAHELGHFLGLSHTSDSGNLMLSSSGETDTDITYDQYKTILDYGRVFVY